MYVDERLISLDDLKTAVDKIAIDDTDDKPSVTIQILLVTANNTEYGAALTFLEPLVFLSRFTYYTNIDSHSESSTQFLKASTIISCE